MKIPTTCIFKTSNPSSHSDANDVAICERGQGIFILYRLKNDRSELWIERKGGTQLYYSKDAVLDCMAAAWGLPSPNVDWE